MKSVTMGQVRRCRKTRERAAQGEMRTSVPKGNKHRITNKTFIQMPSFSLHRPCFPQTGIEHLLSARSAAGCDTGQWCRLWCRRAEARRGRSAGSQERARCCSAWGAWVCSPESLGGAWGLHGLALPLGLPFSFLVLYLHLLVPP